MQAIANGFFDERMIRNLDFGTCNIFGTRRLIREDGCEKIVRPHPLDGRRNLSSSRETKDGEGPGGIPAPARGKHRRIQQRLSKHIFDCTDVQEIKNQLQRKAVLLAERDDDAVDGCRSLELEIETPAEAFAQ